MLWPYARVLKNKTIKKKYFNNDDINSFNVRVYHDSLFHYWTSNRDKMKLSIKKLSRHRFGCPHNVYGIHALSSPHCIHIHLFVLLSHD